MQRDQQIDGELVKRLLRRALRQEPRIRWRRRNPRAAADPRRLFGEDGRRAETQSRAKAARPPGTAAHPLAAAARPSASLGRAVASSRRSGGRRRRRRAGERAASPQPAAARNPRCARRARHRRCRRACAAQPGGGGKPRDAWRRHLRPRPAPAADARPAATGPAAPAIRSGDAFGQGVLDAELPGLFRRAEAVEVEMPDRRLPARHRSRPG